MRILLITERFGDLIPTGVISERLAEELHSFGHEIAVVSSQRIGEKWQYGPHLICNTRTFIPGGILLRLSNILRRNFFTKKWQEKMYKAAYSLVNDFKPDVIYARSTPIDVCEVAARLKKESGIKTLMHFTDPMPEPIEWDSNSGFRKRMIKTMEKILPYADLISFGNEAMVRYQQSLLKYSFTHKTFISPDPGPSYKPYFKPPKDKDYIELVYMGSIYGNRNPHPMFQAVKILNDHGILCKLKIYDINRTRIEAPENVSFVGRTQDIKNALLNGDILINLDGDDKTPVFISSKIKEYFSCFRPIISITPLNSPSREITSGLKTIMNVDNNVNNIITAIKNFNSNPYKYEDFSEREDLIAKFHPTIIARELESRLQCLLK